MKKIIALIYLIVITSAAHAHDNNLSQVMLKNWELKNHEKIRASFFMFKNEEVYLEDAQGKIQHFPIQSFIGSDQDFVYKKQERIEKLNQWKEPSINNPSVRFQFTENGLLLILLVLSLGIYTFFISKPQYRKQLSFLFATSVCFLLYGFTDKELKMRMLTATSTGFLDSAFMPFKPKVYTHWDATYFYVECKGIPDHEMMTGITSWQQQVPIPQCYTTSNASNHWSIPLNPVFAATPVPVNQSHFLRGAIALAVNGIPIFNPYTNTGIDAFVDGQLDYWGGHSGRADDYHYHIAPLHLYGQVALTKPIAIAFDGFAVYGSKEPDGSNMSTLDANHGHYGSNGVYHYHGTSSAPYMIGNMVGQVTEDATLQIIPQAAAKPVRTSLTPLSGATITAFTANVANNGYNLTYTKSGQTYQVNYWWTDTTNSRSKYTFRFVSPAGYADSVYLGSSVSLCLVPTTSTPVSTTVYKTMKRIPDTGETLSYTSTFGEDHDYLISPSFFVNNGNGTTTDTTTGLMWQKVDGGEMSYDNAVTYCDTLTLGGYTDWRLPNPHEGLSILNLQNNPAIDGSVFTASGLAAEYWWTNTKQANDSTKVWCTNSGGGVGNKPKTETVSAGGTKQYHVRAVRDITTPESVSSHFTNNGNNTISDNLTRLMWQRIPHTDTLAWENALTYADTMTLGGYIDWRLPNIKELQSLNDEKLYTPSIDTAYFKVTNNKKYWSGTTLKNASGTQAWFLNTQYGITSYDDKTRRNMVLCVRGTSYISNNYVFSGNGNWDLTTNWLNYTIPPVNLPSGYIIYVDPIATGQCNLNITQTISAGGILKVNPRKTFVVPGSLIEQ